MAKRAGQIVINLTAGTAQFVSDIEKAKVKVRDFGSVTKFNMAESSAAIKVLEGNFANSQRAVARFLAVTLHLGPVISAAFPVIGAVLLGKAVVDVGGKVAEFFKAIANAPEKIHGAFRELGAPLQLTNDQLQVANDRLANDIAKLEGRRQNTLKLALDEAAVSADNLADSLDKDLDKLYKLLKEESHNKLAQFFGASGAGKEAAKLVGGETGMGGWKKELADINEVAEAKIRAGIKAKDSVAVETAERERNLALTKKEGEYLDFVNKKIDAARILANTHIVTVQGRGAEHAGETYRIAVEGTEAAKADLEIWEGLKKRFILPETRHIPLTSTNEELTKRKGELEAAAANARLDRPYKDRVNALNAEIEGIKAKITAIGQGQAAQVIGRAYGEAVKAIAEVNKELERNHSRLTDAQMGNITSLEISKEQTRADEEWRAKLQAVTTSIGERIHAQELLTAAIGQGFKATQAANVETRLMQELGEKFNDLAWMRAHAADVGKLRAGFAAEYRAQNVEQITAATDKLGDQIELERSLAQVQAQGAEAVRLVALAYRLAKIAKDNDAEAARKLIHAEIELYEAQRANVSAANLAAIDERAKAIARETAAVLQGAEAERKAALETKYAEMVRTGASGPEIKATRAVDEAEHQKEVLKAALATGMAYKDQIERIDQQLAKLKEISAAGKETLETEISRRNLENERLDVLAKQSLAMRTARDGLKAFFYDMQKEAKSAAEMVYEALHSAVDRLSNELANLFTGQKTNFRKIVVEITHQMIADTIKADLQKGLGALGKLLGFKAPSVRGDSPAYPLYVNVVNMMGVPVVTSGGTTAPAASGGPGKVFGGQAGPMIWNVLGSLLQHRAMGGETSPGSAYWVGEYGPEIFSPGRVGQISSAAASRRMVEGGVASITYQIDARGAELGVETRIRGVLQQLHTSAVATAVQAAHEQARRSPAR